MKGPLSQAVGEVGLLGVLPGLHPAGVSEETYGVLV